MADQAQITDDDGSGWPEGAPRWPQSQMTAQSLVAAERLIAMLTYSGGYRGYARGSKRWGDELYEASTIWTFYSGQDVDLSWINLDE